MEGHLLQDDDRNVSEAWRQLRTHLTLIEDPSDRLDAADTLLAERLDAAHADVEIAHEVLDVLEVAESALWEQHQRSLLRRPADVGIPMTFRDVPGRG